MSHFHGSLSTRMLRIPPLDQVLLPKSDEIFRVGNSSSLICQRPPCGPKGHQSNPWHGGDVVTRLLSSALGLELGGPHLLSQMGAEGNASLGSALSGVEADRVDRIKVTRLRGLDARALPVSSGIFFCAAEVPEAAQHPRQLSTVWSAVSDVSVHGPHPHHPSRPSLSRVVRPPPSVAQPFASHLGTRSLARAPETHDSSLPAK